jgi:hypothetical protein
MKFAGGLGDGDMNQAREVLARMVVLADAVANRYCSPE